MMYKQALKIKKPSQVIVMLSVVLVAVLSIGSCVNRGTDSPSSAQVSVAYVLENMTERQKLENLSSVYLYRDGTARLATPLISSYRLPDCTYTFADGELLIYANIETKEAEKGFGVQNGDEIARFTAPDEHTLIFRSASVPLFAEEGARYVSAPSAEAGRKRPPDLWSRIYLGMTDSEVTQLLGEPDFTGSGLYFFGYHDIGSFYFSGNFYQDTGLRSNDIVTRIMLSDRSLDLNELISAAVKERNAKAFTGDFAAESHVNLAIDANEKGFTAYIVSLYETFLQDGEYRVKTAGGTSGPLALTFTKNADGDYTLTEYWQPKDGNEYTSSIRSKFPKETWDRIDPELYIRQQSRNCYDEAMLFFVGAVPRDGRYGIGSGTAVLTGVAEDRTDGECFMIRYFPGATLQIEEYDGEHAVDKPDRLIIKYADPGKNISVGRDGSGEITISEDLIGIFHADKNQYVMKFEKYVRDAHD